MPGWQPNWSDVAFDHSAAAHAVAECDRVARRLADVRQRRGSLATRARQRWEGPYAERFDVDSGRLDARTEELIVALRSLAATIQQAAGDARADQARREADRVRWHREKAAEEQRARDEAERRRQAARP